MSRIYIMLSCLITIRPLVNLLWHGGKLWQAGEPLQYIAQVGIGKHLLTQLQQIAQVVDSWGNTINEMLFMLEIATKTVSAEHLQGSEEHKQTKTLSKMAHGRHFYILFQRLIIHRDEVATQLERIFGRGLPEKRGKVIIIRALAATLKIDEERITLGIEHDITRLEVAIHESLARL